MSNVFKLGAIVVGFSLLSACGGSSTGVTTTPTPTQPTTPASTQTDLQRFTSLSNEFDSTLDSIDAMNVSSASTMNNASGTASFSGQGGLIANPTFVGDNFLYAGATVIGDATINVNFNNDTIGGSVTNFVGVDRTETVDAYTGTITINNGFIGETSPSLLTANYNGTLTGNGDTVVVRGGLEGQFSGNPGVRAVTLVGAGDTGTVNGTGSGSILVIAANRN